jgi:hypothetical protein
MKKWLYFAGLKILELCGVVLLCWVFYWIAHLILFGDPTVHWSIYIFVGLVLCIGALGTCILIYIIVCQTIPSIIRKNIEWANKLSGQPK